MQNEIAKAHRKVEERRASADVTTALTSYSKIGYIVTKYKVKEKRETFDITRQPELGTHSEFKGFIAK